MKSLGEYLRSERLNRGISLEEISRETKISMRMLQAIEDGNPESLPAGVLVKGFLRAYAQKMGLDPETVILRYQDLYEEEGARREALQKFHEQFRAMPSRKRFLIPGVVAVLVLCLLLVWLLFPRDRRQPAPPGVKTPTTAPQEAPPNPPSAQPPPATVQSTLPSVQSTPPAVPPPMRETVFPSEPSSAGRSEPAARIGSGGGPTAPVGEPGPQAVAVPPRGTEAAPSAQPSPPASPAAKHVLRAEVVDSTWLKVSIDEGRASEYLLKPGQQLKWQAKSKLTLMVGNAAGLRLFLNDKPLRPLGRKGQVVSISLPDDSLLQTTAAAGGPASP